MLSKGQVELRKLISPNLRLLLPGQFIRNCQIDLVRMLCAVGNKVGYCTNLALNHPFVKRHRVERSEGSTGLFLYWVLVRSLSIHPCQ